MSVAKTLPSLAVLLPVVCSLLRAQAPPDCSQVPPITAVGGPRLANALGWDEPQYYSSIQTGDIDGDGWDDLVARGKDGIHAWRFDNGIWAELGENRMLDDDSGIDPRLSPTATRVAVLEPETHQNFVVARRSDGIHVYGKR